MKYLPILIITLFNFSRVTAQQSKLETLKNYYKNQSAQECLKIYEEEKSEICQIILIRHGEPDLNKKGWRGRNEAVRFAAAYDTVGIVPFDKKLHCFEGINTNKVYHSSLPRARHTAQLLFGAHLKLIENDRFREFERKVMKFINLKMPLLFWLGTSRLLWLMDLNNKDIETFKEAKSRAMENALFLAEQAKNDSQVILVAHGLHNKYVIKYLRENGWESVRNGGSKYLAVNVLAKAAHRTR